MSAFQCSVCKRPLSDPESIRRGIGPVCGGRQAGDGEKTQSESPDATAKLAPLPGGDVVCSWAPDGSRSFNVPHVLILHSPTGMAWGYSGSGPADFALNILFHFTHNRVFAERHHQDFKAEFIVGLPRGGGVILGNAIRIWIELQKARDRAD